MIVRSVSSSIRHADIVSALYDRGFVSLTSQPLDRLRAHFSSPRTLYAGFDPTAKSLHLGHLILLSALRHAQSCGHRVICLIGGATAAIGDPSGRTAQRTVMTDKDIQENTAGITENIQRILCDDRTVITNNAAWYSSLTIIPFFRDIGNRFRVSNMLTRESVASRLSSGNGISFTEFSYMMLQAYDWWKLYNDFDCTIQVGGNDQWGNITAGTEYIHKRLAERRRISVDDSIIHSNDAIDTGDVIGLTVPLLTTSSGVKFGKSSGNAIWLNDQLTTPYDLYQHLLHTDDRDCERFMKLLTNIPIDDIHSMCRHDIRSAIKTLARDVTLLVHGKEAADMAIQRTEQLFHDDKDSTSIAAPSATLCKSDVIDQSLVDIAVRIGLTKGKRVCRQLISDGGFYLNQERVTDQQRRINVSDVKQHGQIHFRLGKQKVVLLQLIS